MRREMLRLGNRAKLLMLSLALGWLVWNGGVSAQGQTSLTNLPPSVGEVVKLAQAKLSDDVILAYIKSANVSASLTADQIVYLNSQGVSQAVIAALLQSKPGSTLTPAPANPAPAPTVPPRTAPAIPSAPTVAPAPTMSAPPVVGAGQPVSFDTFQGQLAPYGAWIQVPGYGLCWQPGLEATVPDWRPYGDGGHWVYTDSGWLWQSDYPWGEIVFHYGRWFREPRFGWLWLPGYDWGPAWVCWRHADGYAGWAPLPPAARFVAGVGLMYNGRVGVAVDFGLRDRDFIFVGYDHFWMPGYRPYLLPPDRVAVVFRGSVLANDYRIEHGHFYNEGIGRARVEVLTHRKVEVVVVPRGRFEERRGIESRGGARRFSEDRGHDHRDR